MDVHELKRFILDALLETSLKGSTYSDDTMTFNVLDLFNYAKNSGKQIVDLSIDQLHHNIEHSSSDEQDDSRAFKARMTRAKMYPIIVIKYPRRMGGKVWIADGRHRLMKAIARGDKTIRAYVLSYDEIKQLGREDVISTRWI
jgi:phosphatidylserine/phosphatidylglycerophosphate/cardiolipin synthase-like enzyme